MEKIQTYQGDSQMAEPDAPLPDGFKILGQEDLDRLEAVETVEELKDVYDHFLLYHGKSLGPCSEFMRKKAREEREERRARKRQGKEKKYKTIKETVKKTITRTSTKTVTVTETNDDGDE